MILQALVKYYDDLFSRGKVSPRGFKQVEIQFIIVLDPRGEFVSLTDTRSYSGKWLIAKSFLVPAERERSGSKAWQTANLLWDHYGYVLGWPKSAAPKDKAMAHKQHDTFTSDVRKLHEQYPVDEEIAAVHAFLDRGDFSKLNATADWKECCRIPGCKLTFQLQGKSNLVIDNETVRTHVVLSVAAEGDDVDEDDEGPSLPPVEGTCIVTGETGLIAGKHPRTPIHGAKSNAKIVSFQREMGFDSYGKQKGHNAPTCKDAAFKYTTVLNKMLERESRQKLAVGDATTVFWAEKESRLVDVFADLFGAQQVEKLPGASTQDLRQVVALFRGPESGIRPELDPDTRFFVLGLSPNAARIAIRFWYAGTVGEVADNINRHFDDIEIIHSDNQPNFLPLWRLTRSIAPLDDDSRVPPKIAGDLMKSILTGTPYPRTLLKAVIGRICAEQSRKDSKTGKLLDNVTYARAALIKSVLARESRLKTNPHTEVGMALDLSNTNVGYRLGRLFAVLERVQEKANPGINATIRDRFYGSASSIPVASFPQLMRLKNHHLSKLDKHKRFYEGLIGEIVDGIAGYPGFPPHLPLDDQGRFAVGYYHQRQDFFKKNTDQTTA